ncbi:MAG: formylmethanofuran--tetrahydromethanopterin N-formyltransferase [Nitrospinota bacterium]|nr:formylmethanofuran--tetrahydromethanopterin N-formyltransferase [Nitrospinota bacterium]
MSEPLLINGVVIEDTFAEAFPMVYSRIIVTAADRYWLDRAICSATGFATSIIGCGVEAGLEEYTSKTPDGRPGAKLLFFTMGKKGLEESLMNRIGQAIMTCPTTAVYNGAPSEKMMEIGGKLRYFGDGFQMSKVVADRRYWRIPVMEGEFVIEESFGRLDGIGGGNFLILAATPESALAAAKEAVKAIDQLGGVILPFPGGVVRSGSKVGSRYKFLKAATNTEYCPTIRRQTSSLLAPGENVALEIVIDGTSEQTISCAMEKGIVAACHVEGVRRISAGNYGGGLGPYHFRLHSILNRL